jgi:hypothetical protein
VYVPGYHVSRGYVNNINVTNTSVSVTRVTNVYNTVVVNRSTTINNVTYVNQRVNGGVTVVSHDAFVNARPVAQNIMRVDQREVASAPVSRVAGAEPVRSSVVGAGRPVSVRPPAAAISRPVVAVRTPPAPQRPIEQRQAAVGGHLNEQALVRPAGPARPAQMNQNTQPQQSRDGFRPFTTPNGGNNQVRQMPNTQPRTYEQQGNPQEANRNQQPENRNTQPPENRNTQPQENRGFRPEQAQEQQPAPATHPLVRPTPPVQERTPQQEQQQEQKFNQWHQQRPAPAPPQHQQQSRPPEPKQEKPPKKGH